MKMFIPTGRIPSNGEMIRRAGGMVPDKSVGWERRQSIPALIRDRIEAKERRAEIREAIAPFRNGHSASGGVVACRKVAGNQIQLLGHGTTVANFQAAKDFARSIGRTEVIMGAIRARV